MSDNNYNNQNQDKTHFVKKSRHKKNDKESKIIKSMYNDTITKLKSEVFKRLNIMARRYYLTYFNKDDKNRLMQKTFSNLFFFNNLYIEIKKDVAKCFKQ